MLSRRLLQRIRQRAQLPRQLATRRTFARLTAQFTAQAFLQRLGLVQDSRRLRRAQTFSAFPEVAEATQPTVSRAEINEGEAIPSNADSLDALAMLEPPELEGMTAPKTLPTNETILALAEVEATNTPMVVSDAVANDALPTSPTESVSGATMSAFGQETEMTAQPVRHAMAHIEELASKLAEPTSPTANEVSASADAPAVAISEKADGDQAVSTSSPTTTIQPATVDAPLTSAAHPVQTTDSDASPSTNELFAPRYDVDRSPQAWLARLQQAAAAESKAAEVATPAREEKKNIPPPAPRALAKLTSPMRGKRFVMPRQLSQTTTQLPEPARRFLRPLLGFDPGKIGLQQGGAVEQFVTAQQADALTDGETILLGTAHAENTPEQLGLLAHELTHIARRHQPRFVPPVARKSIAARRTTALPDEELLAQRVETRVIHAARARSLAPREIATTAAPELVSELSTAKTDWGGLPAPWEPLPDWFVAPPEATSESAIKSADAPQPSATVTTSNAASSALAPSATWATKPVIQYAARDRQLSEAEELPRYSSETKPRTRTAPDLDALAQEVYTILKRRLMAERRRELR